MAKFRKETPLSQLFVMGNKTRVEDVMPPPEGRGAPVAQGYAASSSAGDRKKVRLRRRSRGGGDTSKAANRLGKVARADWCAPRLFLGATGEPHDAPALRILLNLGGPDKGQFGSIPDTVARLADESAAVAAAMRSAWSSAGTSSRPRRRRQGFDLDRPITSAWRR
jgi:hypothetical protein